MRGMVPEDRLARGDRPDKDRTCLRPRVSLYVLCGRGGGGGDDVDDDDVDDDHDHDDDDCLMQCRLRCGSWPGS